MLIILENKSSRVTDDELSAIAEAIQVQAQRDFCPLWNVAQSTVVAVASGKVPAGADAVIVQLDAIDDPEALGYHTDSTGAFIGSLGANPVLDNGGSIFGDPAHPEVACVASVASHEVLELLADPTCNRWLDCGGTLQFGTTRFKEVALEVCDPVEGDSYVVSAGNQKVLVSNFILPAWGDPMAPADSKRDFLGKIHQTMGMDRGGYMVVRSEIDGGQAIFDEHMPLWKREIKQRVGRGAKKLLRRSTL